MVGPVEVSPSLLYRGPASGVLQDFPDVGPSPVKRPNRQRNRSSPNACQGVLAVFPATGLAALKPVTVYTLIG